MITSPQLRQKYLNFFQKNGHTIIPAASLIPQNDPTVLFTTAGMHPLVPYLLGERHPGGNRLADVQKCIRTGDIDEVGDAWHLTFFEMLGNWSLGDYFKKEAIEMSFEFLTKELNIPIEKLAVSCFAGEPENNIPRDDEVAGIWESLGLPKSRIQFLNRESNWWGPAGQTGPCGPDTEMFYWADEEAAPARFDPTDNRWVEIWNDVFMQYNKTENGKYEPLKQKNVDTGMGLERTVAVLNGCKSVFEIDEFKPIVEKIKKLAQTKDDIKSIRIVADHIRAATFILGDEKGIEPSNIEQGYVLRRLIRRAVRYGKMIGIDGIFTFKIAEVVIKQLADDYPELKQNKDFILEQLAREEEKFSLTLEKGLKEFEKISTQDISGHDAFVLFSTYGFPLEITTELATEKNLKVDEIGFRQEFAKHQELSRTASAGKFKGGLADNSEQTTKYHTAAHLLDAALRQVLGDHVFQKGSNITAERLRFDFSHSEKLTDEQKKAVEDLVNAQIQQNLPVTMAEMTLEEAKKIGALGVFESKYGEKVKVYTIGAAGNPFSREICGGPHVENIGGLGNFKITKEESSSSGVRRIKAILG